ncbi:MAG: HAD superfamily hydrolase (TIGR01509 family) [Planctomycetota bacterium]|jgi:HAD superfamily hydrolase (TIGR01509 family)
MTAQAILFDHDGTLVDSEPEHHQMWIRILQEFGVSLSHEEYKKHYAGMPSDANARNLVAKFQLDISAVELFEKKNNVTRDYLSHGAFPLMPGAQVALDNLHDSGFKLAVVTGAGREGIDSTIRGHTLEKYFSAVVCKDDVEHSKPAPDCYLLALKQLGLSASQAIAIEDTEHGVASATQAGIRCLAVPNEMSAEHDFAAASKIFTDLDSARQWIVSGR